MIIEEVDVSGHEDFANHEKVMKCFDKSSGLLAYIAIHNLNLGPALGGCRIWPYLSEADAITDVLRLSKGMTYKSALANLALGGGKAVIIADPKTMKTESLIRAMGRFVESLNGQYITAEDSGTNVEDLKLMSEETSFIAGVQDKKLSDGSEATGDPSPATAYGVFVGIKASLKQKYTNDSLDGIRVAVQGVGNVGRNLSKMLVDAGASVMVSDTYQPALDRITNELDVSVVANEDIVQQKVDVYSPCALGGALNMNTLVEIQAPIVAGAANNQLSNQGAGDYLFHKGIIYAPDYVINTGGIIDIFYEREGYDHKKVMNHIDGIGATLADIFRLSVEQKASTQLMADRLAESRFLGELRDAVA
ncbi:MAG: Glu/Leu/Phe/Val dehydrogenase [Pseudomonadales bacterium]|nr:Glu/Leu/Phe/Val dehydrogenase [Pseudomonadales bacterium]